MTIVEGVIDPGFASNLAPMEMSASAANVAFFQENGVSADWGKPTNIVGWFDPQEIEIRGAVANFENGKAAILRHLRGQWELTFGAAPA